MSSQRKGEGRHTKLCSVCAHPEKDDIEDLWRAGRSSQSLGDRYGLSKNAVQRHTKYYGMSRGLEAILESLIEYGVDALQDKPPTAAHINEAVKSLAKLRGLWVDRTEVLPPGFAGRSEEDLEFYADHGRFPQPGELEEVEEPVH